ncbi:unnamed protein product [Closterium sp. NIES-53]
MLPGGAAVSYVCFDSLEVAGCGSALRADMLLGNLLPSFDSFRSESSDYLASIDSSDDIIVPGESLEDKASPLAVSPAVSAAVAETEKLYGAKAAAVVADLAPSLIGASPAAIDAYIRACVTDGLDSAFYVMDAGVALQLHATWTQLMPRVQPFYAVKFGSVQPGLWQLAVSTGRRRRRTGSRRNDQLASSVVPACSRRTTASKAAALAALTEHASSSSGNASADECAVMDKAAEGQDAAEEGQLCRSTVFGPTCDGLDTILRDVWLPRLDLDDWLVS